MKMSKEEKREMERAVVSAAGYYRIRGNIKRRIDKNDLTQVGLLACVIAYKTYDRLKNNSLGAYLYGVAIKAMGNYICDNGTVLSRPAYGTEPIAESIAKESTKDVEDVLRHATYEVNQEAAIDRKRRVSAIRAELRRILTLNERRIGVRVIITEEAPSQLTKEYNIPVTRMYRIIRDTKRKIEKNSVLYEIWKEL